MDVVVTNYCYYLNVRGRRYFVSKTILRTINQMITWNAVEHNIIYDLNVEHGFKRKGFNRSLNLFTKFKILKLTLT